MLYAVKAGVRLIEKAAPFNARDSLHNARLETSTYLDDQHIEELKHNSAITVWEKQGQIEIPGIGILRRVGFVTEKGYAYSALVGIPENLESPVPVIGTSAWWTSTEGHNEHTVRNLVRAGNFVVFVGAEGSFEPEPLPTPNEPITLADSAAAVLNFAYHATTELADEGFDIDTEKRIAIGESRGGMVGMGIAALAEDFAQDVIFSDFTAPCLPRKMEPHDLHHLAEQIAKEPIEIIKLLGKVTLGRLVHYPATFDLSPYSMKHQLSIGFALFSGEAGALAKHIKKPMLKHITVFENDFASMPDEWEKIFADNPNVRITRLAGSHLTLADHQTLQYIIGRNKLAQQCLELGTALTPESIFDAAHEVAPLQQPLVPSFV